MPLFGVETEANFTSPYVVPEVAGDDETKIKHPLPVAIQVCSELDWYDRLPHGGTPKW
jgi:hypothetical protein